MRLGATLAHLSPAPPRDVASWSRELVAAGFESLWVPQVIGRGSLLLDPFVTLAVAATATDGVELGTATLQVPLHHPAELAHRILSLAAVCGSRLSIGLSPGSSAVDYATSGRDHSTRFEVFDRNLARLRVLLADGGDDDAVLAPGGPVAGNLPLLLGSWGAKVERAAEEFDGWLVAASRVTPDAILAAHDRYRAAGGRRAVVCGLRMARPEDLDPTAAVLQRYAAAGFDDVVVVIEPGGPSPGVVADLRP